MQEEYCGTIVGAAPHWVWNKQGSPQKTVSGDLKARKYGYQARLWKKSMIHIEVGGARAAIVATVRFQWRVVTSTPGKNCAKGRNRRTNRSTRFACHFPELVGKDLCHTSRRRNNHPEAA